MVPKADPTDLSYQPKRHLHRFSRFSMCPNWHAVQCIVNGDESPQHCPFPLGLRHPAGGGPSHGDRQHAQKLVQIARVVREICSLTHTHTHTHTHTWSLQYFATAPAGESGGEIVRTTERVIG